MGVFVMIVPVVPIMDRLKRSHFLGEPTGKVHLTQYNAVSGINSDPERRTREAQSVVGNQ